jgi:Fic family protein
VTLLLPDPDQFLYTFIRKEAVLSSQIEGTQSSLSDLLLFENDEAPGVPRHDAQETANYIRAMDHGVRQVLDPHGLPISSRLLREVHSLLLSTGRGASKNPGRRPGRRSSRQSPTSSVSCTITASQRRSSLRRRSHTPNSRRSIPSSMATDALAAC